MPPVRRGDGSAGEATDKASITVRLRGSRFDARDVVGIYDISAPDLIATMPLAPESSRESLCGNLNRLLAIPAAVVIRLPWKSVRYPV